MKKTALLSLFCLTLLSASLSHAMLDFNPETKAFYNSAHRVANKAGDARYMHELAEDAVTPIQEFLTLTAPVHPNSTLWTFMNTLFKQMLNFDRSFNKTVNRTNPQTGNTALGDLITHCHPTNNYVHHMAKHLINAGARLENIDTHNHCFWDLLEVARSSGALSKERYDEIVNIPAVQEHIAAQKAWASKCNARTFRGARGILAA